ncbi:MAG: hypothetical protein ACOH2M_14940 [Cypionkella sp.]
MPLKESSRSYHAMTRRNTPQKIADEKTWPIRICVVVPGAGFSGEGIDRHAWFVKELGLGGFAIHPAGGPSGDVTALYFRTLADAGGFFEAFPTLRLAEDTASPLY